MAYRLEYPFGIPPHSFLITIGSEDPLTKRLKEGNERANNWKRKKPNKRNLVLRTKGNNLLRELVITRRCQMRFGDR